MREIKFRAFRENDNAECKGDLVYDDKKAYIISGWVREESPVDKMSSLMNHYSLNINGQINICKVETVGQYTGLKDKQGKEIYEGDILRVEPILSVIPDSKPFNFEVKYVVSDIRECQDGKFVNFQQSWFKMPQNGIYYLPEVIGNIYENSNLLK